MDLDPSSSEETGALLEYSQCNTTQEDAQVAASPASGRSIDPEQPAMELNSTNGHGATSAVASGSSTRRLGDGAGDEQDSVREGIFRLTVTDNGQSESDMEASALLPVVPGEQYHAGFNGTCSCPGCVWAASMPVLGMSALSLRGQDYQFLVGLQCTFPVPVEAGRVDLCTCPLCHPAIAHSSDMFQFPCGDTIPRQQLEGWRESVGCPACHKSWPDRSDFNRDIETKLAASPGLAVGPGLPGSREVQVFCFECHATSWVNYHPLYPKCGVCCTSFKVRVEQYKEGGSGREIASVRTSQATSRERLICQTQFFISIKGTLVEDTMRAGLAGDIQVQVGSAIADFVDSLRRVRPSEQEANLARTCAIWVTRQMVRHYPSAAIAIPVLCRESDVRQQMLLRSVSRAPAMATRRLQDRCDVDTKRVGNLSRNYLEVFFRALDIFTPKWRLSLCQATPTA